MPETRPRPQTGTRPALLAIGLVYLLLAGFLAARQPEGRFPDEARHLEYAIQLAEGRGGGDFRLEPAGTETHQPPGYYLLAAGVIRLGGGLVAVRLLSVLAGLVTMGLTWRLAQEWVPEADPWVAVAAAGAVGFLPMNFYLSAAVNNDPAVILVVTGGLLLLARGLKRGFTARSALGLGLVCGLALMVKSTGLCLLVAATVGLWPRRGEWREGGKRLGALALGVAVVAGPWLTRNTLRYGDPLAARAFSQVAVGMSPEQVAGGNAWLYWVQYVADMFWLTSWGAFDGLQGKECAYPIDVYLFLSAWPLLAILGWVRGRGTGPDEAWRRRFHTALAAGAAVLLGGFISFNLELFQAQARYFFAFLPAVLTLIMWGLARLGRGSRGLPVAFAVSLFLATLWGLAGPMWAGLPGGGGGGEW